MVDSALERSDVDGCERGIALDHDFCLFGNLGSKLENTPVISCFSFSKKNIAYSILPPPRSDVSTPIFSRYRHSLFYGKSCCVPSTYCGHEFTYYFRFPIWPLLFSFSQPSKKGLYWLLRWLQKDRCNAIIPPKHLPGSAAHCIFQPYFLK